MFVVAARYLIKDGNEKAVLDILKKMIPISRAEPACRFYAKQGCELAAIHRFAYPELPNEVQLLWYKDLKD